MLVNNCYTAISITIYKRPKVDKMVWLMPSKQTVTRSNRVGITNNTIKAL